MSITIRHFKKNMMKIEFGSVVLNIPDKWENIRLGSYERVCMRNPETRLEQVQYVADLCGIDVKDLLNYPARVFDIILSSIGFVFNNDFKPCNEVEIENDIYIISTSDKLTLAEWVDVQSISDNDNKLSEMLAIICRPKGEEYKAENTELFEKRTELFKNLSCDKALPLIGFFLHKRISSQKILNHYSTVMDQANRFLKDTKTFALNGGGIKQFPIWQKIRYIYLMKSLEKQLSKCSDSFFTK